MSSKLYPHGVGGFAAHDHAGGFSVVDVGAITQTYRRADSRPSASATQPTPRITVAQARSRVTAMERELAGSSRHGGSGFDSLGEWLHTCRFKPNDERLAFFEKTDDGLQASQRMDDGASGGFAVPVQFRPQLLSVKASPAIMRPRAMVLPAGDVPDASLTIPALDQSQATNMYGGVTLQWIGEGALKPETNAKIRQVTLQPQEVAGVIKVTDKLLRNWQSAGSFLAGQLRAAIAGAEDMAFLVGDGVAKPLGVLNSPSRIQVNRTTPGSVEYADILAMDETLFGLGADAIWVCSKRMKSLLRQIKNPAGYYIWQEDAAVGAPPTLLGHPVMYSDRVPTLGNRGDLMLFDPNGYVIKDGSGPFVAFSEHVHFTTNETLIKVFWNVDGQSWTKDPIKTENGDIESHFVILN